MRDALATATAPADDTAPVAALCFWRSVFASFSLSGGYGPPRGYWCFGFESFNKVIKAGSARTNWKNESVGPSLDARQKCPSLDARQMASMLTRRL